MIEIRINMWTRMNSLNRPITFIYYVKFLSPHNVFFLSINLLTFSTQNV